MTPERAEQIFRSLQREMGLDGWEITLTFKRDNENFGTCDPAHQYREADINIDLSHHVKDVRKLMIHELAHAGLAPLAAFAVKLCNGNPILLDQVEELEDAACTWVANMPRFHQSAEC